MAFLFPRKIRCIELLAIITGVSLLVSCNMSMSAPSKVSGSSASTSSATAPPVNTGSIAVNADNLHIQTNDVIDCPEGNISIHFPPNHLVLADDRTTYDSSEIQQITNYVDALYQTDETTGSIAKISTPFPPTLRWAAGVDGRYSCLTVLEITNTGDTTIQIPQVSMRLKAKPRQNLYHYHLIDACSLSLKGKCKCDQCGSGGGDCSSYNVNIELGVGQQDSLFSATPSSNPNPECREMTLTPGSTFKFFLNIAETSPNPLIYSLTTELTLQTTKGQQILALPQLGNLVVFASSSQFSCYALRGQTFVQEDSSTQAANCI